jgi:hypothetical protein
MSLRTHAHRWMSRQEHKEPLRHGAPTVGVGAALRARELGVRAAAAEVVAVALGRSSAGPLATAQPWGSAGPLAAAQPWGLSWGTRDCSALGAQLGHSRLLSQGPQQGDSDLAQPGLERRGREGWARLLGAMPGATMAGRSAGTGSSVAKEPQRAFGSCTAARGGAGRGRCGCWSSSEGGASRPGVKLAAPRRAAAP